MASRIAVVVSQGQSHHPAKRNLEEEIVGRLLTERSVEVTVIPNLYDLTADGSAMLCLQGITHDMLVLAWMYPRATRWILSRNSILGQEGITLFKEETEENDGADPLDESIAEQEATHSTTQRVIESLEIPDRKIYCLNLATATDPDVFVEEIKRIAEEAQVKTVEPIGWLNGNPKQEHVQRMVQPPPGNIEHQANTATEPSTTKQASLKKQPKDVGIR